LSTSRQAAEISPRSGASGSLHSAWIPPAGGSRDPERVRELARERGRLHGEIECIEAELFRVNLRRALRPSEVLPASAHAALRRYVAVRRQLTELRLELEELEAC